MNVKKFFLLSVCALATIALCVGCARRGSPGQVCYKNTCFDVALAVTPEEKSRGLQFRETMSPKEGMLFIFSYEGRHNFWMKDTLIPLDMIWLDRERRVVHMEHQVPPCRMEPCEVYAPAKPGLYVLELAAGQAAAIGLRMHDQIVFKLPGLK